MERCKYWVECFNWKACEEEGKLCPAIYVLMDTWKVYGKKRTTTEDGI